jgi:hypothetical protein
MSFQGHIEKGMVVVDRPLPLPDGTPVRVEPIEPANFWQSVSIDELADRQGVKAPKSVDELLGGWPADELNDDFDAASLHWRERELENRQ